MAVRLFLIVAIGTVCVLAPPGISAADQVDYETQVKPIFRERCFTCHGALKQKAGLRLDTVARMIQGGDSGAAFIVGDPDSSELVSRLTAPDLAERMPPEHEGEPLSDGQIAIVKAWIRAGALAPSDEQPETDPRDHWSFRQRVRPVVPAGNNPAWVKNPIDAFLSRSHAANGLEPQLESPRSVLVRRLYLDLIGLPPSAEELAEVDVSDAPDGYERLVDRLLAVPRHGERWARHWMDIWRYSDWWGLGDQLRNSQKHIWHWRDWIVESINADTPYDEMLRQMLAADELYPQDLSKLRATGFLARNYFLFSRNQWLDETVEHVGKGLLGLTMNCSKCHDHKYDPIAQADFYRLRAFFEPYHVRMDMLPGEANLDRNGLPRIFDALLETPTYRFVRGDEFKPDSSKSIMPGVPEVLAFDELAIKPVTLPAEAWRPAQRSWVFDAHLAQARLSLESARTALARSNEKLAAAKSAELKAEHAPEPPAAKASTLGAAPTAVPDSFGIVDDFKLFDEGRWKKFGGQWTHSPGRLLQGQDGPTRAALRLIAELPQDFDATLRFTILGGSQWRSVGLAFDVSQPDPTLPPNAADTELLIYASANAGDPTLRAAFQQSNSWTYPPAARVSRPIALEHEYTLRVQSQGTLVNVSLDGEPMLAWRSPLARRKGALQLITYDALAAFHQFSLVALASDILLREPPLRTDMPGAMAVADAQGELRVAESAVAVAESQLAGMEQRAEAMRAEWAMTDDSSESARDGARRAALAAGRADREVAAARAGQNVANAELRLRRATNDKRDSLEKELLAAQQEVEKAVKLVDEPTEEYTRLSGAQWTTTRFIHPDKDDPPLSFPSMSSGRRTALAGWITDSRNPLTARVAVNHIWMRHLGLPLVSTVFDFGRKGSQPSQPELHDWLACELVDRDWNMKQLHRRIVTSSAYRMSSSLAGGEANTQRDPDNRLLWRQEPIRLEAQLVRDSILSLAGTLDFTLGGPPVASAGQDDSTRRSLYFFHSNNDRNPFLMAFDEAGVKECYRRDQSIVPQQALALSNSRLVSKAARQIAAKLSAEASATDDSAFARFAFLAVLAFHPTEDQLAAALDFLAELRSIPEVATDTDPSLRVRSNFVQVLINHHDFVTRR